MTDFANRRVLAERVREACIEAALAGYESAAVAGLCGEGALEAAISAMREIELDTLATGGSGHD